MFSNNINVIATHVYMKYKNACNQYLIVLNIT